MAFSVKDSAAYVGQLGMLTVDGGLAVTVTIADVRSVYGRVQVQVTPRQGSGYAWVNLDRVRLATDPGPATMEAR